VRPINTFVDKAVLSENGTINYEKVKPVLFEIPNTQYLSMANVIGKCWDIGNSFGEKRKSK